MKPHFVDLEWYSKVGFRFGREFVSQGLGKLVTMKGLYYPELVKVFCIYLKTYDDGELTSRVNEVNIAVNDALWLAVVGLNNEGIAQIDDIAKNYNKNLVYLDTRINPADKIRKRITVGGI